MKPCPYPCPFCGSTEISMGSDICEDVYVFPTSPPTPSDVDVEIVAIHFCICDNCGCKGPEVYADLTIDKPTLRKAKRYARKLWKTRLLPKDNNNVES